MKILVKWPTRQRPRRFLENLQRWRAMASGRHTMQFLISTDTDDAAMGPSTPVMQSLLAMPDVTVRVGPAGRSKIAACNADVDAFVHQTGFIPDILMLASDDMVPEISGYDAIIAQVMSEQFINLDGALHFNDGYLGRDHLITLSILGWNLYRKMRVIYHPEYLSFFCDNEFTDVTRMMGAYHYDSRVLVRHCHVGQSPDALYQRNQVHWNADQATYMRRRAMGFGLRQPLLSILIPTLPVRIASLQLLLENLNAQVHALENPWQVEIRLNRDDGTKPLGVKRNELLRAARGRYIAFIDDDDQVDPGYMADILSAILRRPGVDCVVFRGLFTIDGALAGPFDYSLAHKSTIRLAASITARPIIYVR